MIRRWWRKRRLVRLVERATGHKPTDWQVWWLERTIDGRKR